MNDQETYDKLTRVLYEAIHRTVMGFWDACDKKFSAGLVIEVTHTATAFSFLLAPTVENKKMSREEAHKFLDRLMDCNGWRDGACATPAASA